MTIQKWDGLFEDVPLDAESSFTRLVDSKSIDDFANAIQSFHPIHMDAEWARENSPFSDRIAHGLMTSALMSRPIVLFSEKYKINSVLVSSSAKYIRPVICGDEITTKLKLVEKIDERKRLRFEIKSTNQKGDVVMVGELVEQLT
jgi:acyl dehydratase